MLLEAVRRGTLERQITTPIALQLSGWKPETPAVLNIASKNGEIASTIQELRDAERTSWDYDELSTADVLTGSTEFVQLTILLALEVDLR